jgi:hypothetical protein
MGVRERSGISTASWIRSRVDKGARERGQEPRSERAREQRVSSGRERKPCWEQTDRQAEDRQEVKERQRVSARENGARTYECSRSYSSCNALAKASSSQFGRIACPAYPASHTLQSLQVFNGPFVPGVKPGPPPNPPSSLSPLHTTTQ